MAQYLARKPPQTLEKLLQKMDEYIRADNDFRQRREEAYKFSEMTRGFGGRIHPRHVRLIHSTRVMTEEVSCRSHNILHNLWGSNKALSGRQLQEAETPGASEEGLGISPEKFIAYSVVRTRAILQGCAMSPFRNKRK
jgi:hypothetical protein